MKTHAHFSPSVLLLAAAVGFPLTAAAVVPVLGPPLVQTPIVINKSAGDQFDPHVSGDWAAYTDDIGIRYYNFVTGDDKPIPMGGAARDLLSGVSGSKIVFSRVTTPSGTAVMLFDAAANPATPPVEINPTPNPIRIATAIGGNTVAYIDFGLEPNGELVIYDLATSSSVRITNDTAIDGNPSVSPDGTVVVWEHCVTSLANCDIMQAVRTPSGWSASVTTATAAPEANPESNGVLTAAGLGPTGLVVYDSQRGSSSQIYWRPVGGGAETQLETTRLDANPSIAGQYISFESRASLLYSADIYVYDIVNNKLYQITNTPDVNEQLNDITLLPDNQCTPNMRCLRVVWASDEDGFDQRNIRAATFQLPSDTTPPVITVPATITVIAPTSAGAVVTFSVSATDDQTANPTLNCVPASGSTFPIGTTVVTCTATDTAGNSAAASFNVVVTADTTAPVLHVPAPITVTATSAAGAPVTYVVTATDNATAHPTVSCSPPSGATFPIGATAVGCSAIDGAGNSTTASFTVTVRGASTACLALDALIQQIQAQIGHSLTLAQATDLINLVKRLKGALGCPY
jgi:hypothetical protein